jgi:hypothetical protein
MSVAKIKQGGSEMSQEIAAQLHRKAIEYVAAYYKTYPLLDPGLSNAIYWSHYYQLRREIER